MLIGGQTNSKENTQKTHIIDLEENKYPCFNTRFTRLIVESVFFIFL